MDTTREVARYITGIKMPCDLLVGGGCADCNGDILMHHYDLEREMLRQIFNNTAKPIETIQEIECGTCLEAWGRDDCPYSGCRFRGLRGKNGVSGRPKRS